jgi:hypothetical protein
MLHLVKKQWKKYHLKFAIVYNRNATCPALGQLDIFKGVQYAEV